MKRIGFIDVGNMDMAKNLLKKGNFQSAHKEVKNPGTKDSRIHE